MELFEAVRAWVGEAGFGDIQGDCEPVLVDVEEAIWPLLAEGVDEA